MNKTLSALLTTAVVTGLLASQVAKAEGTPEQKADQPAAEKNSCKGKGAAEKNSCKGKMEEKKKHGKNSCKGKNGCSEKKDEKAEKPESK